jgi:hypothetical protein
VGCRTWKQVEGGSEVGNRRTVRRGPLWLGSVVALTITACGSSTSSSGSKPVAGSHSPSSAVSHHTFTGVVLTENVGGGYVPTDIAFGEALPTVDMFADGRIYTVSHAFLGTNDKSSLVTVVERTLPASAVNSIANQAQAAGVTQHAPDLGRPTITDLATTTYTLSADGRTSTVAAYGLGYTAGLTSTQIHARKRLEDLGNQLERLGTGAGSGSRPRAYVPRSLSVFAELPMPGEPGPAGPARQWPLATIHLAGDVPSGCVSVIGAANIARISRLAATSAGDTAWISGGHRWHLVVRPDLPGSRPCGGY